NCKQNGHVPNQASVHFHIGKLLLKVIGYFIEGVIKALFYNFSKLDKLCSDKGQSFFLNFLKFGKVLAFFLCKLCGMKLRQNNPRKKCIVCYRKMLASNETG